MNFDVLIPISFFLATAYTIKAVVDARVRRQIVQGSVSQDLVRVMIEGDEARRRHSTLRWGLVLVALALGFATIEAMGLTEVTPGAIAVLLGFTGVGNLAEYLLTRRSRG